LPDPPGNAPPADGYAGDIAVYRTIGFCVHAHAGNLPMRHGISDED